MAAAIGSLIVDISANVASLQRDMNKAQKTFTNGANRMKSTAVRLAASLGAAFTVSSMIRAGQATLETADKYAKMSRSIGISVETLSSFNHVAELSGITVETLSKGAGTLAKNMKDFRDGTGEAKDTIEELGIQVLDSNGQLRDTNSVLLDVAEKFSMMEDGPLKTAAAMEIFGRAGRDMIPMLNAGKEGIAEMQAEAEKLGVTFSTQTAHAAERINDQFHRLSQVTTGIVNKVMVNLLPDIERLSDLMFEASKNTSEMTMASDFLSTSLKLLMSTGVVIGSIFDVIGGNIGAAAAALVFIAEGDFSLAFGVIEKRSQDVVTSVMEDWETLKQIWESDGSPVEVIKTKSIQSFSDIETASEKTAETVSASMTETVKAAEESAIVASGAVDSVLASMGDGLTSFVQNGILDFKKLADSIISDMIRIAVQHSITKPLTGALSGFISNLTAPGPGPSTFTTSAPGPASYNGNIFSRGQVVPHYNGGVVSSPSAFPMANGRTGTMGERGPEAIMPLARIGGKLGVRAEGGGENNITVAAPVSVTIVNQGEPVEAEVEQRQNSNGFTELVVTLEKRLAQRAKRGSALTRSFEDIYPLRRTGER